MTEPATMLPRLPVAELITLLQHSGEGRIALVGIETSAVADQLRQEVQSATFECAVRGTDWFAEVSDLSQCKLIYVCPGDLGTAEFEHRLAGLRDRCQALLLVEESAEAPLLTEAQYFALGFQRHAVSAASAACVSLYAYSLYDYKTPPDWLNAKYWAHPERFDLPETS